MGSSETTGTIRAQRDAEPRHEGRQALEDTEEARSHPAEWARFQRTYCAGCRCC